VIGDRRAAQGEQELVLYAQEEIEEEDRDGGEGQDAARVHPPGLPGGGVDADQAVDAALDHIVLRPGDNPVEVVADRPVDRREGEHQRAGEDQPGHQNFSGNNSANTMKAASRTATIRPATLTALTSVRPPGSARSARRTAQP
jgi:hypothetical protein